MKKKKEPVDDLIERIKESILDLPGIQEVGIIQHQIVHILFEYRKEDILFALADLFNQGKLRGSSAMCDIRRNGVLIQTFRVQDFKK